MGSEKPNFLSQPVVKNVFMFRNGDPYFEARRIVINEKRVCNFETLLREVTGGIQASFGAVRNIYTPRGGHRVEQLESLQSGEQYVAAGKERFKKLDYLQIGTRRKRMMQAQPLQARPLPPNRIIVSARFLKPIREPCTIFVVANGDTFNPATRLLIHQRMMGQFDKILELITEKMGLRVLGGVRSLYTYEGHQVTDGNKLECGQLYVAVGRERFKKLSYSDILFTRPKGTRMIKGMKAYSLPPIYRFSKQSRGSKSPVRSSDSGDGESKDSPPNHSGSSSKEHLSSTVREMSQARLLSLRTRKSGQSITAGTSDNDDPEPKVDDGNIDGEPSQDQKAEENSDVDGEQKATSENDEKTEVKVETPEDSSEGSISVSQEGKQENQETKVKEAEEQNDEKERGATAENEQDVKEEVKVEVTEESKEVNTEEQESSSDKTQGNKEREDEPNASSETEKEQDNNKDEDKQEEDSGNREESNINDAESGEEQKETENSNSQEKTQSDNEKKESYDGSSSNTNQQEDEIKTKEETTNEPEKEEEEESKVNEEVREGSDEVDSGAELGNKDSDS